jgi:hypothetical protein
VGGTRRPQFACSKYNTTIVALSPKVTKTGKTNNIASTLLPPIGGCSALADATEATLENRPVFFHKDSLQSGMI